MDAGFALVLTACVLAGIQIGSMVNRALFAR